MVYAEGNGQLDYVQREVYAGSERLEQFTDRGNGGYERLLYVHEDLQGNTRYYTKENGNSFAELTYDAWGMPVSPNKLLNNDHGNYVYATYTGHIFDTTLDIYFCEARFYDANTRQWMAMDPIKDGGNWYQYCYSNPLRYWDPTGTSGFSLFGCDINEIKSQFDTAYNSIISWAKQVDWGRMGVGLLKGIGATALIVAGIATIAATGGTALPVVVGSMSSTAIMWATQILGGASVMFGANDLVEAAQDFIYPLINPQTPSDNILRDHVFAFFGVSPDEYYLIEAIVGGAAVAGAQVVSAFGLAGSSIGINEWLSNKSSSLAEGGSKPNQVHHFATDKNKTYTQAFKDITDKYGLDLDADWNKELLPHQGRHPNAYHDFVLDEMRNIDNIANGNKDIFLDLYESEIKSIIRDNPDMLYSNYWKGIKE